MPQFTRENAREMSARGNLTRWSRERLADSNPATPARTPAPGQDFSVTRLARVRAVLDRVDKMLAIETDPAKLDRLAAAADKLSQQECWLSGRPRPGVRRPTRAGAAYLPPLPPPTEPQEA